MTMIIFVSENHINGKKSLGIGSMDDIRKMNGLYYMTNSENIDFKLCLRDTDTNKMWKLFFLLKFNFEMNEYMCGYNTMNKTVQLNDREMDVSVEDYIQNCLTKIQWFDSIEDVTSKVMETDWSRKDVVQCITEEQEVA